MPSSDQVNNISEASQSVSAYLELYGARLIISIFVYIILSKIIKYLTKLLRGYFEKRSYEPKISNIAINVTKVVLNLIVLLLLAAYVGVEISNIVLIVIAIIVLIAIAMKDTLANIGAGFIMYSLKLFKNGDYLEIGTIEGTVKKIDIYHTAILRPDNSCVLIPNSQMLGSTVVNTDKERKRRVDIVIYVSYKNDIERIKQELLNIIKNDKRILDDPKPFFNVIAITNVSIGVRLCFWIKKEDYWDMKFEYNEKAVKILQKAGVKFPITSSKRQNIIK